MAVAAEQLERVARRIDTRLVFASPRGGVIDLHNFARRDWHPRSMRPGSRAGASVRVLEMHYAHRVRDAEETARVKLDAHASASA